MPISRAGCWELLKSSGAERVSEKAAAELQKVLVDLGAYIGLKARRYAQVAGRITIKAEDVRMAVEDLNLPV